MQTEIQGDEWCYIANGRLTQVELPRSSSINFTAARANITCQGLKPVRFAVITILTGSDTAYIRSAIALFSSVKTHTATLSLHLVLLLLPGITLQAEESASLDKLDVVVGSIPELVPPKPSARAIFEKEFVKLYLFNTVEY